MNKTMRISLVLGLCSLINLSTASHLAGASIPEITPEDLSSEPAWECLVNRSDSAFDRGTLNFSFQKPGIYLNTGSLRGTELSSGRKGILYILRDGRLYDSDSQNIQKTVIWKESETQWRFEYAIDASNSLAIQSLERSKHFTDHRIVASGKCAPNSNRDYFRLKLLAEQLHSANRSYSKGFSTRDAVLENLSVDDLMAVSASGWVWDFKNKDVAHWRYPQNSPFYYFGSGSESFSFIEPGQSKVSQEMFVPFSAQGMTKNDVGLTNITVSVKGKTPREDVRESSELTTLQIEFWDPIGERFGKQLWENVNAKFYYKNCTPHTLECLFETKDGNSFSRVLRRGTYLSECYEETEVAPSGISRQSGVVSMKCDIRRGANFLSEF